MLQLVLLLLMLVFALSTGWNAVWILVYVLGLLIVSASRGRTGTWPGWSCGGGIG